MRFVAQLQEMADSEISAMVDQTRLAQIKLADKQPLIKAFVVGHEGESRGHILGIGNVVKRWFRTMIVKLHEMIGAGLKLFHGHGATNEHAGREPVGEVVGKALKTIDGRESVVVACYIRPEFKHLPLDIASVETEVALGKTADGAVDIVGINSVTGIALGNSAVEKAGFPGATLLGQLQAFEKQTRLGIETPALRLGISVNPNGRPEPLRLG